MSKLELRLAEPDDVLAHCRSGRAEAYQKLRDLADYRATNEPHSPVSALIRRAFELVGMILTS